jgi:hypothetical protein
MQFLSGFGDGIDYAACVFALDLQDLLYCIQHATGD